MRGWQQPELDPRSPGRDLRGMPEQVDACWAGSTARTGTGMTHKILSRSAVLSDDPIQRYRYSLSRTLDQPGQVALWIGVNPSTADAEKDDASIRKLYGFGRDLGIRQWLVGNLFAYRSTDVRQLSSVLDPVGPDNDRYLLRMIKEADLLIAGWGNLSKIPNRLRQLHQTNRIAYLARSVGKPLMCWGTCGNGDPCHPLMLPYTTQLRKWEN
jgi:hypothetical protein